MPKRTVYNKFNRGEVSENALARDDVEKVNHSAASVVNFLPVRLGPMQFRPGTEYIGNLLGASYLVPFVRSASDKAIIEFSDSLIRIWKDDDLVGRAGIDASATTLGALSTWTLASGATYSAPSILVERSSTTVPGYAWKYDGIAVADRKLIGLRLVIEKGPMQVDIGTGSTAYLQDIFSGILNPGSHNLDITAGSSVSVTVSSINEYESVLKKAYFIDGAVFDSGEPIEPYLTLPTSFISTPVP